MTSSRNTIEEPLGLGEKMEEDEVLEVDSSKSKSKTGNNKGGIRKKRSPAWNLFEELPVGHDKKKRAKCKRCGIIYISESNYGTGNLLSHMKICKPKLDVSQMLLSQSSGSVGVMPQKFDIENFQDLLVKAIIRHNLPFTFVEYQGIRDVFRYISEDIKLPCRNTIKSRILKLFKSEKNDLRDILKSTPGRICLTSDLWTSVATDGYLTITAHFVDDEWRLNKKILNFCIMPPPHTGLALSEKIYSLVNEWGIDMKIFSMTLDNASNNNSFIDILKSQLNLKEALILDGSFFHVRCCAHILNLIVQDGLKEIDRSIVKIRESVKYIKGSAARKYKFYDCVAQVSLEEKKGLRQDVPTRWNSTYLMLDSAIYYRRAFTRLELSDSNFKSNLTNEEWDRAIKINNFLGLFYEATCLFSGTKYPTSNLFFTQSFLIRNSLKEVIASNDVFMNKMGTQMYTKFEKYWSECNVILAIAIILDPRYKIHFVEWAYTRLYESDSLEFQRVKETMYSLFEVYSRNSSQHEDSSDMANEVRRSSEKNDLIFEDFDNRYREGASAIKKTELDKYFDEEKLSRKSDIDILCWWKMEQFRYPILSNLARDVLSIPISTVASESAFSIGGRVLSDYRSSLLPETVQALLCTRDWLFGKSVLVDKDGTNCEALTEDIFNLRLNDQASKSGQSSNTFTIEE